VSARKDDRWIGTRFEEIGETMSRGITTKPSLSWNSTVASVALLVGAIVGGTCCGTTSVHQLESVAMAEPRGAVMSVRAKTAGVVLHVHVAAKQLVKAGDPIVELDASDATIRLGEAETTLATARALAHAAEAELQRAPETERARAHERAEAAEVRVVAAEAALTQAAEDDATFITAPRDGVVAAMRVADGQSVTEGQAMVDLVLSRN
jgi:membrane fusion protein (multidrug efflux system)